MEFIFSLATTGEVLSISQVLKADRMGKNHDLFPSLAIFCLQSVVENTFLYIFSFYLTV